ncbi:MAG TPA: metallophosphoesterase, partial [Methanoregula sp.]|nr:metallophosphoesterase [Methanoregula sp.]
MAKVQFFPHIPEELPGGRSIIVVSDLHLGGNEDPGTAERFSAFLDFLDQGIQAGTLPCTDCPGSAMEGPQKNVFYPPEKIILLGDVLELWDSRELDRNHAMLDLFFPLLKLKGMDCDVVYVTGNHDEDMGEILSTCKKKCDPSNPRDLSREPGALPQAVLDQAKKYREHFGYLRSPDPRRRGIAESIRILWNEQGSIRKPRFLEICSRHFPAHRISEGSLGVRAGSGTYA